MKELGSKKARAGCGWWKHKRRYGKRTIARSNRQAARQVIKEEWAR